MDCPGGGDKKAITMGGENFQVKIMGGAGLTSNLDRPNMPAATLTMPVCIDRSRPPKREGQTKEERGKRRRSRWTEEGSKTYIPGMPTMIPEGLSPQQEKVLVDAEKQSKIPFVTLLIKSLSTYCNCHSGILASIED